MVKKDLMMSFPKSCSVVSSQEWVMFPEKNLNALVSMLN